MNPPRLHIIEALDSPLALILRRGPSREVCTFLWDRDAHTFQMGQWLKGRIYAHRTDLSPDGRHMVCFATDGHRSWTAISRAPWLTALMLLPQKSTWHGGGAFTPNGALWLNGGDASRESLPDGLNAAPADAYPHSTDGFSNGDLYATAQTHRGWRRLSGEGYDITLEKKLGPALKLRMQISVGQKDRALLSNQYALQNGDVLQSKPDWEWVALRKGLLQFAAHGTLFEAEICSDGLGPARPLLDFSGMRFEPRTAPYAGADGDVW